MFEKINTMFNLNANLLNLYAKREEILSSNIANSETPHYKAMDINFKDTFQKMLKNNKNFRITLKNTSKNHLTSKTKENNNHTLFSIQPIKTKNIKINGNTVDMNRERIEFIKNTLKYEENLIFIKNEIKNMMLVLKG
ncbi:flagellar basal body rod protein FlgB [Buchnera aphidicola]|uniref:Flagellar basal body rod protein FlgB n=1 Tax=Buchnera aphidicola (Aphis aurantii) TaxID=1470492 RepID=A0AAU6W522_9GAMM